MPLFFCLSLSSVDSIVRRHTANISSPSFLPSFLFQRRMDGWKCASHDSVWLLFRVSVSAKVFSIVKRRIRGRERAKQKRIASPSVKSLVHPRHLSVGGESLDTLCILLVIIQKCFLSNWLWAERGERQPLELQLQNLIQFNKHWNNSSERLHRTTTRNKKKKKKEVFFLFFFFFKLEMQLRVQCVGIRPSN